MLTEEDPKQYPPGDDRGEKALDGPIATASAGPAGKAQHRDASGHDQQGVSYPTALAEGCCRHMGSEALEKCYNVHHGLLHRLWRVAVVVTTTLRQFYDRSPVR